MLFCHCNSVKKARKATMTRPNGGHRSSYGSGCKHMERQLTFVTFVSRLCASAQCCKLVIVEGCWWMEALARCSFQPIPRCCSKESDVWDKGTWTRSMSLPDDEGTWLFVHPQAEQGIAELSAAAVERAQQLLEAVPLQHKPEWTTPSVDMQGQHHPNTSSGW